MPESKGHLNPGSSGLVFDRFELGEDLADLVRHVWVPLLTGTDPVKLIGLSESLPAAAPIEPVRRIMASNAYNRDGLVEELRGWLLPVAAGVDDRGRLVNEACRLAEEDTGLTRAADLAERLGLSPRSLERLVRCHIGMTPKWLIECRRLQQAATTLFAAPGTDLSALAAELEYTDYSHFFRRYQRVHGESPKATRDRGRRASEVLPGG